MANSIAMGNLGEANGSNATQENEAHHKEPKSRRFLPEDAHIADYYSRIGVPLIYLIFMFAYVGYYVGTSKEK